MKLNIALRQWSFTNVIQNIGMQRGVALLFVVLALTTVTACSEIEVGHRGNSVHPMDQAKTKAAVEANRKTMTLAMAFYKQGGFTKASELFLKAADRFHELNASNEERNALLNAAKMQLKVSRRIAFVITMTRVLPLIPDLEMPTEEERFLVNLSDQMNHKPLTYPVKSSWQVIFQKNIKIKN